MARGSAQGTFSLAGGTHSWRPSNHSSTNRTNTRAGRCVPQLHYLDRDDVIDLACTVGP